MIEVSHLTKRYGSHLALDDLSFTIPEGQIYGLLGPNGAGKSTTMNILTGCLAATSGRVRIDGVDIFEDPMAAKKHLGYLPELPPLYMDRTPEEYLRFVARAKGIGEVRGELERVMALTQITDVKDRLIRNLSKGYRQRVGIAQAILGDPDIIILDEPTVGLDPRQITEIRELIQKLGENKTVILSSHILSEVQAVCDSILILSRGKLVACDTPDNLERLLTGGTALELEADTQPERLEKLLGNLPGVTGLTVGETAGKHAWARLETGKENLETLSKAVFFRLCEEKLPLLRLTPAKASLEDIFLELTGGKEA
ncbi:MAG: ABC transporter ATP-binding protein [Candidatus Faecousia sp.]|nr:ABC transporter ATP-binding protein [Candidatus Faecousia sp.]